MKKEIPVLYTPTSFEHNPPFEVFNGLKDTAQENVERVASILKALKKTDFANIQIAKDPSLAWVEAVHDKSYLEYLARASKETAIGDASYPSVHPYVDNAHTAIY